MVQLKLLLPRVSWPFFPVEAVRLLRSWMNSFTGFTMRLLASLRTELCV